VIDDDFRPILSDSAGQPAQILRLGAP